MNVVTTSRPFIRTKLAAALVAAVAFSGNGLAQSRLSLAERVSKLEAQTADTRGQQNALELLTRLNDLQAEVQSLRSLVEQQNFELQRLKKSSQDQYLDLDSRLQNLNSPTASGPDRLPPPPSDSVRMDPEGEPLAGPEFQEMDAPPPESMGEPPSELPPPRASASGDERAAYDRAFDALKQGQYNESSRLFDGFLSQYPSGEFADNASYWLGESYYVTQKYSLALKTFQSLLARFPQSAKAPDSLLKVGYCHYQLGDLARATSTLKDVIDRYPDQPVAKLAEGRLRALQLEPK